MTPFALINTNRWNRIRYTLYAPGYDIGGRIFSRSRNKSIKELGINPDDEVLIVGAGTGLDLEFMPTDCHIIATDITPAMISQTLKKNILLKRNLKAEVMDGQRLTLPDRCVDKIILHLILTVIPDPVACLKECERVLKPGGRITIFDKFVHKGQALSFWRKLFNPITNFLFSNISRRFESIVSETGLVTESDAPADFNGNFRIIRLIK
ncbi:MAG TPA: class I SAM-dependent methyltransferase [Prolixibacteraceae bacterium]|nr:class I SAM-dependent methyltransferase [Prolixibacteraceae bacterium]